MEMDPSFVLEDYVRGLSFDLNQYAATLHRRDAEMQSRKPYQPFTQPSPSIPREMFQPSPYAWPGMRPMPTPMIPPMCTPTPMIPPMGTPASATYRTIKKEVSEGPLNIATFKIDQ